MSNITLYDYWRSSASYRVRIALNLKGLDFETVTVDLLKGEQKAAENLHRNPQGLVPSLDLGGDMMTQSLAIIEYLDELHPSPALMPTTARERARVRTLSHAIAMDIHPVCNLGVVQRIVELAGGDEQIKVNWMREFISKGLGAFEELLGDGQSGRFCHGEQVGWQISVLCHRFITPTAGASIAPTSPASMQFSRLRSNWRPSKRLPHGNRPEEDQSLLQKK